MEDLKKSDFEPVRERLLAEQKWLFERRFEFAWNSFDFHAKQRTTVFNFFLVFSGIVASAFATLFKDGSYEAAAAVATVAGAISIAFVFLEHRNEELVHYSEDVLRALEEDVLFADFERKINHRPHPRRRVAFFWWRKKQTRAIQLGIHLREGSETEEYGPSFYRHGRWFPLIQLWIAAAFLTAAGWAYSRMGTRSTTASLDPLPLREVVVRCESDAGLGECRVEAGGSGGAAED